MYLEMVEEEMEEVEIRVEEIEKEDERQKEDERLRRKIKERRKIRD